MVQSAERSVHDRRSGRRRRSVERTRRDILAAAARVFSRGGLRRTTMEEIAREAGYSVGALYTYFSSKEELCHSLRETIDEELAAVQARPVPASLDFWQGLELMLLRHFEVLERNRDWIAVLVSSASELEPRARSRGRKPGESVAGRAISLLAAHLERGVAAGALLPVADPVALSHMAIGAVHARVDYWALSRAPGESLMAHVPDVMRFLSTGLAGRAAAASARLARGARRASRPEVALASSRGATAR
jgi:AcrR family transcriptional regulator